MIREKKEEKERQEQFKEESVPFGFQFQKDKVCHGGEGTDTVRENMAAATGS